MAEVSQTVHVQALYPSLPISPERLGTDDEYLHPMKKIRSSLYAVAPMVYMVALMLVGCGEAPGVVCTKEARSSLQVTVLDAVTGRPVCDAMVAVTALNGNLTETLTTPGPTVDSSTCNYFGPYEQPGRFLVMASREGYQTAQQSDVAVGRDECHVQTVELTLQLQPTPRALLP